MIKPRTDTIPMGMYGAGRTPLVASRYDPRFSFCLYVPRSYSPAASQRYQLAVIVHGTTRTAQEYRDSFADFAEHRQCIVLAPLFPVGICGDWELDSYKFLLREGIRFDLALLDMIEQVAERYRIDGDRFLLHGFSGGGQFAHRFLYLHPKRLLGVSIGAPGLVTLLDETRPWWVGVDDLVARFGCQLSVGDMRETPVSIVVGALDLDPSDINSPDSPNWMPGAYDTGLTRVDRARALASSLSAAGIAVEYVEVAGVAHQGFAVIDEVTRFFNDVLDRRWQPRGLDT